jgi:RHS repeat-associated protein
VTAIVNKWVNQSWANHGFLLKATNEDSPGYDVRFYSSESSANPPYLEIEYQTALTTYYFLKDHLGNIRVTVDKNGTVVTTDDYYPFGLQNPGRSYNVAFSGNQYKFGGKELDDENNLNTYWFEVRPYDPEIGRFTIPDPMGEYPSPYIYVGNNPINFIDPTGMFSEAFAWHFDDDGNLKPDPGDNYDTLLDFFDGNKETADAFWEEFLKAGGIDEEGNLNLDASVESTTAARILYETDFFGLEITQDIIIAALTLNTIPKSSSVSVMSRIWSEIKNLFGGGRIKASNLKSFKKLVQELSKPGSELTQKELDQLKKLVDKFGGKLRFDLNPVKGKILKPHVQIEGLGSSVRSRHIWLAPGVK